MKHHHISIVLQATRNFHKLDEHERSLVARIKVRKINSRLRPYEVVDIETIGKRLGVR